MTHNVPKIANPVLFALSYVVTGALYGLLFWTAGFATHHHPSYGLPAALVAVGFAFGFEIVGFGCRKLYNDGLLLQVALAIGLILALIIQMLPATSWLYSAIIALVLMGCYLDRRAGMRHNAEVRSQFTSSLRG
ncbi:hypothetical protein HJC99_03075 [Candidatus Saccharibacteria bacterium]|nr:hypothetical protein [Candidatus Saccharibacteria bacterium]